VLCSAARTPIFVSSSTSLLRWSFWWSLSLVGDKRTLFTRRLTGPWSGARLPTKIFRGQVFFGNDPSSAASLRSTTRKWVKDGWLWGFLDQEDPEDTNQPRPSVKVKRWRQHEVGGQVGPGLELTTLTTWRLGPSTGAHPASWSSVFSNQVFSEYNPSSATSLLSSAGISARSWVTTREILQWWCTVVYSGGIQSGQQICPLWARVDWGCDTPSGWCGGTGGTPSHS